MKPLNKVANHYVEHPPVKNGHRGSLVRWTGSGPRSAFWAGYDGLKGGLWPPTANSILRDAYDAGKFYRSGADKGILPPLPTA
jgi:hypothetical protein